MTAAEASQAMLSVRHPLRFPRAQLMNQVAAYRVGSARVGEFNHAISFFRSDRLQTAPLRTSRACVAVDIENILLSSGDAFARASIPVEERRDDGSVARRLTARLDIPSAPPANPTITASCLSHRPVRIPEAEVHQAFLHFVWEKSSHRYLCEVLELDPAQLGAVYKFAVHTNSDEGLGTPSWPFGTYNGGRAAIKRLAREHRCNDICKKLRLVPFVFL
jgi:hypothetical protein